MIYIYQIVSHSFSIKLIYLIIIIIELFKILFYFKIKKGTKYD